jgi:hypothetical protein
MPDIISLILEKTMLLLSSLYAEGKKILTHQWKNTIISYFSQYKPRISFYCCAGLGCIVAFIKVLTLYQMYCT